MEKMAAEERFDRRALLENAQHLVQQNKVSQAIHAYEQLVRHDPGDWNSANTLGDLLVRARHVDQAIREYIRIAHYLVSTGFLARASAIYKKVLRLDPTNADALRQTQSLNIQRFTKPDHPSRGVLQSPIQAAPAPAPLTNTALDEPAHRSLQPAPSEPVNAIAADPAPTPATPSAASASERDTELGSTWSWDQPDPSPA
jgi:tetratricopeptide (TPR) repeat protein